MHNKIWKNISDNIPSYACIGMDSIESNRAEDQSNDYNHSGNAQSASKQEQRPYQCHQTPSNNRDGIYHGISLLPMITDYN